MIDLQLDVSLLTLFSFLVFYVAQPICIFFPSSTLSSSFYLLQASISLDIASNLTGYLKGIKSNSICIWSSRPFRSGSRIDPPSGFKPRKHGASLLELGRTRDEIAFSTWMKTKLDLPYEGQMGIPLKI